MNRRDFPKVSKFIGNTLKFIINIVISKESGSQNFFNFFVSIVVSGVSNTELSFNNTLFDNIDLFDAFLLIEFF